MYVYMHIHTYKYERECVYIYVHAQAHTELYSLETQKANLPLHRSVPHGLPCPLPHALW